MRTRYYSVPEVNALLPQVREAFSRVLILRTQIRPVFRRLEEAGFAPEGTKFDIVVEGATIDVLRDRATFRALIDLLNVEIAAIGALGGTIKDLDTGLIDWSARKDDRDILLCWRLGEDEVRYWHDLETGVAGRRPVQELLGTEAGAKVMFEEVESEEPTLG